MTVRGLKLVDNPLLTGEALIHMTKNFSSSIIILFEMCLKGILICMDHDLSFITHICPSIPGTCLILAVVLIFNTGKSGIRK